ncbi:MAG: hypothetical protein J1F38_10595 [Muribaculaceae bacterium]|nr:hypothetical protein [Muribaculaceae bacterium]
MGDRHVFRGDWLDYNEGIFFVTVCCKEKKHLFGKIQNNQMIKNELGSFVDFKIKDIPNHNLGLEIHNHIVMPNHLHILLQLLSEFEKSETSALHCNSAQEGILSVASLKPTSSNQQSTVKNKGCLKPPMHGNPRNYDHFNTRLAVAIGGFKAAVTREWKFLPAERTRQVASLLDSLWQPRFHDHYVRDQWAYDNIYNYISTNPENWDKDVFNEQS